MRKRSSANLFAGSPIARTNSAAMSGCPPTTPTTSPAHHVAHATACEVRDVPLLTQARGDFARALFHGRRFHMTIVTASLWKSGSLPDPAGRLFSGACAFLLPKRVNDKQHYRNRDTR